MSATQRKLTQVLAACLSTALLISVASAETFYKWVDKNGVTHYSKEKPTDVDAETTLVVRSEGQAVPGSGEDDVAANLPVVAPNDGEAIIKGEQEYAKARERAMACNWATGGLKIAEGLYWASQDPSQAAGLRDTESYREEVEQMKQAISQNCAASGPAS